MARGRSKSVLGAVARNVKRNATNKSIGAVYELMWGEKPKRGRKKKDS